MEMELKQQYEEMGIDVTTEILLKSEEICLNHNIQADEFVEQWTAFSISSLNGVEPTISLLLEFERKVLLAKRDKELAAANKKKKYTSNVARTPTTTMPTIDMGNPLDMYGISGINEMDAYTIANNIVTDDNDPYNTCHTPKAKSTLTRTPARHNDGLFSPASYSPITGTPRTYASGSQGSGKIVYTFGNASLINTAKWNSTTTPKIHVKPVILQHGNEVLSVNAGTKYMFDSLREKSEIAGDRLFYIGKSICQKILDINSDDFEVTQVDAHTQSATKTIGVIYAENDANLDQTSAMLLGADETTCRSVCLNFNKTKSFGIFPGQIVMVSGINPKGDLIMVEEVTCEHQLEGPIPPKIADPLSFVIAAGPFTHDDDLVYDPLNDLMNYLKDNKPDVLILLGPFLDAEHKLINDSLTLAETFDSFFEKMIAGIIDVVGTMTKILIVASQRDANAEPVYPTMPMSIKTNYPNVQMLSDPVLVDINGINIGMTSTDIIDHLANKEFVINGGDKVKRLVNYLLLQGSFYPLNPPAESVSFDSNLANKYANIKELPNILIVPSDQKCFIRDVNGCLAINPGRLADGNGGTFARFIIKPPAPKEESKLINYMACQIRKI